MTCYGREYFKMASEMERVLTRARQIKLVIFDVDGVLTDGRLYFDRRAASSKAFTPGTVTA